MQDFGRRGLEFSTAKFKNIILIFACDSILNLLICFSRCKEVIIKRNDYLRAFLTSLFWVAFLKQSLNRLQTASNSVKKVKARLQKEKKKNAANSKGHFQNDAAERKPSAST